MTYTLVHKKVLDVSLKDLRNNNNMMGGALVLLCEDFHQTPPVTPGSTSVDEIHASLKHLFFVKTCAKVIFKAKHESSSGGSKCSNFLKQTD